MKGVYAAFFMLEEDKRIEVGALGKLDFKRGLYIYIGSGGNNVVKRLERHFSQDKNTHWHIDYFTVYAEPLDYFILPESTEMECELADIAKAIGEPVTGFGCGDCGCDSHFFRIV